MRFDYYRYEWANFHAETVKMYDFWHKKEPETFWAKLMRANRVLELSVDRYTSGGPFC